jgi:hypothetical protein
MAAKEVATRGFGPLRLWVSLWVMEVGLVFLSE